MSSSDYDIHLKASQFDALWDAESGDFPFGEDPEEINRILAEELLAPRRRTRKKKPNK